MAQIVEKWGVFEITVLGPSAGNPFTEHWIRAVFQNANERKEAEGFYDGDGVYRARFMPSFEGEYSYEVTADFLPALVKGAFSVTAPLPDNHGPVRVSEQFHFAYEDGTPFYPVGTTCYAWAHQSDESIRETLNSLRVAGFNKLRFCVLPKHFQYNLKEPRDYPFEGTPMDSSVLTEDNFSDYNGDRGGNSFDRSRLRPAYFQHLERCILALQALGVEADLIMMHPYDRWGFSRMSHEEDMLYWRYCVARFSAYRNVWWSLANEYDLLEKKSAADWESYADVLTRFDPYRHLRSIHHCFRPYDYSRPWVTHCSLQCPPEVTSQYRERYGKPVVLDEMCYEGDIPWGWGNLTAQEMVRRFWEVCLRGGYPGHGETYLGHSERLWWSHGGKLWGESWKRVRFLQSILQETPGPGLKIETDWNGMLIAVPEREMQSVKSLYLYYFLDRQPSEFRFRMDPAFRFRVQIIDTWNMTIEEAGELRGSRTIPLPGRPHIAVRLIRQDD